MEQCEYKNASGQCLLWKGHLQGHICDTNRKMMDVEYFMKLARCYKQLHEWMLKMENEIDWPVCIDPRQRRNEFWDILESLYSNDEWIKYYRNISHGIEQLLDATQPKDKTKLDGTQILSQK